MRAYIGFDDTDNLTSEYGTGKLARNYGSSISEQDALLVSTLLSPWGGIKIGHDEVIKRSTCFAQDCLPVMHGMPPYD